MTLIGSLRFHSWEPSSQLAVVSKLFYMVPETRVTCSLCLAYSAAAYWASVQVALTRLWWPGNRSAADDLITVGSTSC